MDLLAIFITGLMVGSEFAVAAFVHPALNGLETYPHLVAAKRLAASLGRLMPPWYALGLLAVLTEIWLHRTSRPSMTLLVGSAVLWAATIIFTVIALVPRNNRIAALDPQQPYSGWTEDRRQWDRLHRLRVAALAVSFAMLVAALLRRPA